MTGAATDRHVEDTVEGAPPTVLVHSSGLSGRQWSRLAPALAKRGARVIVPYLTGHGKSAPGPFSFRTDVALVADLLRSLGSAHVVGHSYGGLIALHAALAEPRLVRSL